MIEGFIPARPLSLYIHVPFCHARCDYCAFYSSVFDRDRADKYYDTLKKELELIVEEVKTGFHTVYFGGGNPVLLGSSRILELLTLIERYGKPTETTIEINPEDITPEIEELYPHVTRISTGIQSMSDRTLTFLNRRTRVKDNTRAMEYLSSSPFIWNADIITAVPTTTVGDTLDDIGKVAAYNPHHISFYCLTFEEGTPLVARSTPLGDEKEREFLLEGWKDLEEKGYGHYEISAFAKKGYECSHNRVYWKLGQYIGLGPSAESFLGYTTGVSMRNTEELDTFLSTHAFDCDRLTKEETEESYLLTALRTREGINKEEYRTRFSENFDDLYKERIESLDSSWYNNTDSSFSLTEEGMLMLNTVILTLSMAI